MIGEEPRGAGGSRPALLVPLRGAVNSGFWKIGVLGWPGHGHWPQPRIEM